MTEKQLRERERKRQRSESITPNEALYQKLERLFRLKRERIADGMPPKWKSRAEYKKAWRAKQKRPQARKEADDGREKEGREKRQETPLRSHDNGSQNQNA